MPEREWVQKDRQLLDQEAVEEGVDPVEASLTELDEYLHTLPIEEHQAALEGIREYQKACLEIDLGWHRYL